MPDAVRQVVSLSNPWQTLDPFLFCVYHRDRYPPGRANLGPDAPLAGRALGQDFSGQDGWSMYHGTTVPGFPAHPHAGFETVTIVTEGLVDHADSLGAAGRFGRGDVQWMTAGRGVQHAEMFPLLRSDAPNPLELFQIWLNLSHAGKRADPHYQMLWHEQIPVVTTTDAAGRTTRFRLVAGSYDGTEAPAPTPDSWAANPAHGVVIWLIDAGPEATFELPAADPTLNRALYCYRGAGADVAGHSVAPMRAALLRADAAANVQNGTSASSFLFLQGRPIGEPVAQYGPFVANSQPEIQEMMRAYQRDQFGGWPWPSAAPVHPRERGRFARYPDGREEIR